MKLQQLVEWACDKERFTAVSDYAEFSHAYLETIPQARQAVIVSTNEHNYIFYQYGQDAGYNITRPLNSDLLIEADDFQSARDTFMDALGDIRSIKDDKAARSTVNRFIYTCQQTIGAALDALPGDQSNTARKINGDLFERYIRLILNDIGVPTGEGTERVPVTLDGKEVFCMSYQHDLIVCDANGKTRAIGSVKTSSKDRIDKIFIDKFLYNRLTGDIDMPHFAVFLNDVQRARSTDMRRQKVNGTFLTGHFKGYTVKLNPLDGVYYCDLRPIMQTDELLAKEIHTIDNLLVNDVWNFLA